MTTCTIETILTDLEEKYSPPDLPCLKVSVVDDIAFLDIGEYSETSDTSTFATKTKFTVEVSSLVNALLQHRMSEEAAVLRHRRD